MNRSLQNCSQVFDNCQTHASKHPLSWKQLPTPLQCIITHPFPSPFFTPVLLMKGADGLYWDWCQLHWVLCQIIYTSSYPTPLSCEFCAHWTAICARDWQRAKYATFEVPIKTNLKIMKQLCAVVEVWRGPLDRNKPILKYKTVYPKEALFPFPCVKGLCSHCLWDLLQSTTHPACGKWTILLETH